MKGYITPNTISKASGYTDNVASNLKLSGERATSVMGELAKLGIESKRILAEGFGEQHPVASNDTEEEKAQNRRIAVRVTQK